MRKMTFHPYFLCLYLFYKYLLANTKLSFRFLLWGNYYISSIVRSILSCILIPLKLGFLKKCLFHWVSIAVNFHIALPLLPIPVIFPVLSPHPALHLAWSSLWSMVCNNLTHIFFLLVGSIVHHFTISDILDRGKIIHIDLLFQFMCHSSFYRPDL